MTELGPGIRRPSITCVYNIEHPCYPAPLRHAASYATTLPKMESKRLIDSKHVSGRCLLKERLVVMACRCATTQCDILQPQRLEADILLGLKHEL